MSEEPAPMRLGLNEWLVDEMYERYRLDPSSVSQSWQEFFEDYEPRGPRTTEPARPSTAEAPEGMETQAPPEIAQEAEHPPEAETPAEVGEPIRGAGARIVSNMEASLEVPTATSFRQVPTKLLEVNRKVINGYLGRKGLGKVSFTHLIAYAVVRSIVEDVPAMSASFHRGENGEPRVVRHPHVGLGIAVDIQKSDGSRSLLVPCIRDADTLDFATFHATYEDLIRKVRTGRISPDDFAGVTATITNPGTIGTAQSVPRLMPGQGVIVGVGAIEYPPELQAADPATIAQLGVSKVVTLSSTYDHRVIQGAESGLFLRGVAERLLGEHDFYREVFGSIGVPYEPVEWKPDRHPADRASAELIRQMQVSQLINQYRVRGHLIADLDPLATGDPDTHAELDPATYGLTIWDLDREFQTGGRAGIYSPVGGKFTMKLSDLLGVLRDAYCRTIGVEYMHIAEPSEKRWIQQQVEGVTFSLSHEEKLHLLSRLCAAEALEKFLDARYVGQKRFGIEGAESAILVLEELLAEAAASGSERALIGMAHRGRLNVLVNVVGKTYEELFRDFEGYLDPDTVQGSGDVRYHLGQAGRFRSRSGDEIDVEVAANPSHLEAVDPVLTGMARARIDQHGDGGVDAVLPVLIHGDAAFAGQGVVAETFNLSKIRDYHVGGTVHLVVNNQLGFTTPPQSARSSEYPTDIAKMVQAPIFHVNGDDPEACVRVARLAHAYRQQFHKDVVIDMFCYRRFGHSEADDPSYTQPLMYKRIQKRRSVRKLYTERLVRQGEITLEEAEAALDEFHSRLQGALDETRQAGPPQAPRPAVRHWIGLLPPIDTGVPQHELTKIFRSLSTLPEDFSLHPKLERWMQARNEMFKGGEVDWSLAEALAIGSLLAEGTSVRLAGQDSRRGTFSQRHAVLVDFGTGAEIVPLAAVASSGAKFTIVDSLLSEFAALGFEYGYSVADPSALVCWEAQFGDFANGAQVVIDQFIVAAEDKWEQASGIVLLLPHGFEGQGPEHSSARIERFLTLAAEGNIEVVVPSTAAQYFHLLRRQVRRDLRRPLVLITPKSFLRAQRARSPVESLASGCFQEVLDDAGVDHDRVTKVVLASGKVAHELMARRDELRAPVAVVRVEQLYPWPEDLVEKTIAGYPSATQICWVQEEPSNMGARRFVEPTLREALGDSYTVTAVSRPESASPATGAKAVHDYEQEDLLNRALPAP